MRTVSEHAGTEPVAVWPLLRPVELRRLHFLAYCRATGRLRPAAPVRVEVEVLCASLLHGHERPQQGCTPQRPLALGGVPPLWQAWVEQHR